MADVTDLADRVRRSLATEHGVTEQRMFGGRAFLLDGNMAVAASGGGLMVRIDPDDADRLLTAAGAERMEMKGRPMQGWLLIDAAGLRTERQLDRWVRVGVGRARSLPPKTPRPPRARSG